MKPSKKQTDSQMSGETLASVRALISFPPDSFQTLEKIAAEMKFPHAWAVREAAAQSIAEKWPLLKKSAT